MKDGRKIQQNFPTGRYYTNYKADAQALKTAAVMLVCRVCTAESHRTDCSLVNPSTLQHPWQRGSGHIGKGWGEGLDQEENEVICKEAKTILFHREKKRCLKEQLQ